MERLSRINARIVTGCGIASEAIVLFVMFLVTGEAIGRRFFGQPIPGQMEMATLCLILIIYLGLPYTQLKQGHIRVESLVSRMPRRAREALELFSLSLSLFVALAILWATAAQAIVSVEGREFVAGVISFPVWPGKCVVVLGFILLSITLVIQFLERLRAGRSAGKG